jgi:hypothetical protein
MTRLQRLKKSSLFLIGLLALSLIFLNACSQLMGFLMPVVKPGIELSTTRAKNDTALAKTENARLAVFGEWFSKSTTYYLTFVIENNGQKDITINFGKLGIKNVRIQQSQVGFVRDLKNSTVDNNYSAGSDVMNSTVIIKPLEKKTYQVSYTATASDGRGIVTNETVNFMLPGEAINSETDVIFEFRCATDYELVQTDGSPRPSGTNN